MPVIPPNIIDPIYKFRPWLQGLPTVSLSSMFPDLSVVDISGSVDFSVSTTESGIILQEHYVTNEFWHADIKGLREILSMYLQRKNINLIIQGQNNQLSDVFTFTVNGEEKTSEIIYCRIKSDIPAEEFKGNLYLNTQYLKKVTTVGANEFLTRYFVDATKTVGVKMYYRSGESVASTDYVTLISGVTGFYTFDASFTRIKTFFPDIPADDCLFYRVGTDTQNVEYMIDRSNYLTLQQLVFMNAFGAAETLQIRGEIVRHIDPSFDEGKVNRISRKWNQKENETFEASSGKIFLRDEYDIWRDMFMSSDVYLYVNGTPRKIFVTEAKNSINRIHGINTSLKFTFRFAEENDTWDYMRFIEWILSRGVWNDGGVWMDSGQWNDNQE